MDLVHTADGFDECPLCGAGEHDVSFWSPGTWPCVANPDYPEVPVLGVEYPLYGVNCLPVKKNKGGRKRKEKIES
jgi:hypothetical protein